MATHENKKNKNDYSAGVRKGIGYLLVIEMWAHLKKFISHSVENL